VTLTAVAAPSIIAEVDPEALRTIIGQLVSNALKFTPAGGEVTVAVTRDDHFVWLRVADTGTGISHDHQRQVFDRFFRAPAAQQGAVPGTGLGLSIVKALVDAHHGSISLTSELGDGTTVVVGLPLDAADRTA
jgi:signal transduction histidine kinase